MDIDPSNQPQASQDVDQEKIKTVAQNIQSADEATQASAMAELKGLLCVQPSTKLEAVIDQVISHGILDRLAEIIKSATSFQLKYNTLWCFINVCCGDSTQVDKAIEAGLLPLVNGIIDQAIDGKDDVLELAVEAVWLIGNISGDSIQHRDALLDLDAADKIVAMVKKYEGNAKLLDNGIWALQNLVSKKPAPFWNQVEEAFKLFLQVLGTDAPNNVRYHALWGLCYLSGSYTVNIVDSGCLPVMVKYIGNEENRLVFPAVQVLGNVISSTRDNFTDEVLKLPDLLPSLFKLCENTNEKIKIYATWTISNIAAGTPQQISQIIDNPDYIQKLGHKLDETDEKVRYQASCALSNLVFRATVDQIEHLITKHEYLDVLLKIMRETDLSLYEINLITAIEKIIQANKNQKLSPMLKDKGLLDKLQEISGNLSYEMRVLANELIRNRLTAPSGGNAPAAAPAVNTTATNAAASTSAKTTPKKSQPKAEPKAERPKEAKKIRKAPKTAKKKAPIRRTKTMQDTLNEAKALTKGIRKGGRTRQDSKPASVKKTTPKKATPVKAKDEPEEKAKKNTASKVKNNKKIMKRTLSMKQTLAEAKQHIKHIDARKKSTKK